MRARALAAPLAAFGGGALCPACRSRWRLPSPAALIYRRLRSAERSRLPARRVCTANRSPRFRLPPPLPQRHKKTRVKTSGTKPPLFFCSFCGASAPVVPRSAALLRSWVIQTALARIHSRGASAPPRFPPRFAFVPLLRSRGLSPNRPSGRSARAGLVPRPRSHNKSVSKPKRRNNSKFENNPLFRLPKGRNASGGVFGSVRSRSTFVI